MYEWTNETMHKAPPPMPDKERFNGCAMTAFGLFIVAMVAIIGFGVLFGTVIR